VGAFDGSGGNRMTEMDLLTELITVHDAAQLAGVSPAAIRTWVHRGQLPIIEVSASGRNLYRLVDVAKAERATRKGGRRLPPTGG
jgi:hypothetical protein